MRSQDKLTLTWKSEDVKKYLFFKVGHFCWRLVPQLVGNIHHHIHSFIHQTMKGGEGLRHALQTGRDVNSAVTKNTTFPNAFTTLTAKVNHFQTVFTWRFVEFQSAASLTCVVIQVSLLWRQSCSNNALKKAANRWKEFKFCRQRKKKCYKAVQVHCTVEQSGFAGVFRNCSLNNFLCRSETFQRNKTELMGMNGNNEDAGWETKTSNRI